MAFGITSFVSESGEKTTTVPHDNIALMEYHSEHRTLDIWLKEPAMSNTPIKVTITNLGEGAYLNLCNSLGYK